MSPRKPKRRPAGALEGDVLAALWAADGPLTPAEVQEQIGNGLAYTTVMTAMARLYEKGVLGRLPAGRGYTYLPVLDRPGITAAQMRDLLDSDEDREAVLARFVGALSPADERALADLLARER